MSHKERLISAMKLEAIIVRADGVLADTGAVYRCALEYVLEEAGFERKINTQAFDDLPSAIVSKETVEKLVVSRVKALRRSEDAPLLASAVFRRSITVFDEMIEDGSFEPRPGAAELLSHAVATGMGVALISNLPERKARELACIIPAFAGNGQHVTLVCQEEGSPGASHSSLYERALLQLGADASRCLLFESSGHGLDAAHDLNLAAIVVRSSCSGQHGIGHAVTVVDHLPEILGAKYSNGVQPNTPVSGEQLIEAAHVLHGKARKWFELSERRVTMRVSDILKEKGSEVKTITAGEAIQTLARRLNAEKVGAMVVVGPQGAIEGIISERDIARGIAIHGGDLIDMPVKDLMTKVVITCAPVDSIFSVARVMTQRRIRHLPVTEDGKLAGLVSIGDVLKYRLEEVQLEANVLRDYTIALR